MNALAPALQTRPAPAGSLWERLKTETRSAHGSLDARIMAGQPFADLDRYARFLMVQHDFHRLVSPLYQRADLGGLLPDLAGRDRLDAIREDLNDLGHHAAGSDDGIAADVPAALGWLYVAEGSNLGAAFLLKAARGLGLSEEFGARHLAGAPEGRGLHWKTFTQALDAIPLQDDEADRVIAGANAAFTRVRGFVEERFFQVEQARG